MSYAMKFYNTTFHNTDIATITVVLNAEYESKHFLNL